VEKVRTQFLSLRQNTPGNMFSGRFREQIEPNIRPFLIRVRDYWLAELLCYSPKGSFSPNLWTPAIQYGSRKPSCFGLLTSFKLSGVWSLVCTENLSSGVVVVKSAKDGV
jgi:hypothetical protein